MLIVLPINMKTVSLEEIHAIITKRVNAKKKGGDK